MVELSPVVREMVEQSITPEYIVGILQQKLAAAQGEVNDARSVLSQKEAVFNELQEAHTQLMNQINPPVPEPEQPAEEPVPEAPVDEPVVNPDELA